MTRPQRYYRRRSAGEPGRYPRLEMAVTVVVIVAVVVSVLVFLLVYHDLPFRLGEPSVIRP